METATINRLNLIKERAELYKTNHVKKSVSSNTKDRKKRNGKPHLTQRYDVPIEYEFDKKHLVAVCRRCNIEAQVSATCNDTATQEKLSKKTFRPSPKVYKSEPLALDEFFGTAYHA